jgi:hypothetical protein
MDGAVAQVNLASKPLHFGEQIIVMAAIVLNVSELPGHPQPTRGENYKPRSGSGSGKRHPLAAPPQAEHR